jgi:hypothetical protein
MTTNTDEKVQADDVEETPEVGTPTSQPVTGPVVRPNGNTDPHSPPPN